MCVEDLFSQIQSDNYYADAMNVLLNNFNLYVCGGPLLEIYILLLIGEKKNKSLIRSIS